MRVRVFDSEDNKYFKSEVYAIVNLGWYSRYLVVKPTNSGGCLKFYHYLEKEKGQFVPFINIIDTNTDNWINKNGAFLLKAKRILKLKQSMIRFDNYFGIACLFEQSEILAELLLGNTYLLKNIEMPLVNTKLEDWNYLETEEDIRKLMAAVSGFHDSFINNLNYVSGSKEIEDGYAITDNLRRVTINFESSWCDSFELVFEGTIYLNLRPADDNFLSEIYGATLLLENEIFLFCDQYIENHEELSNELHS